MCKVFAVAGVKDTVKFWELAIAAQPFLNASEKDGFGLAVTDGQKLFVEKWLEPKDAFRKRHSFTKVAKEIDRRYQGAFDVDEVYKAHGKPLGRVQAGMLHSRLATCGKGIENTHPFVSEDSKTALIHNGVIRNADRYLRLSTCDSEALLNQYTDHAVNVSPGALANALADLEGYYACAVLSQDAEARHFLDIFRDNIAPLSLCRVKGVGDVFCTKADIVRAACKALKWSAPQVFDMRGNTHLRIDAETGEVIFKGKLEKHYTPNFVHEAHRKDWSAQGWSLPDDTQVVKGRFGY